MRIDITLYLETLIWKKNMLPSFLKKFSFILGILLLRTLSIKNYYMKRISDQWWLFLSYGLLNINGLQTKLHTYSPYANILGIKIPKHMVIYEI